jgi:hypothetical protein
MFGLLFCRCKSYAFHFDKNRLGYILGDFFTSSSGHPEGQLENGVLKGRVVAVHIEVALK